MEVPGVIDRSQIQRATRVGVKARLALAGPTGSGKTYTALGLAGVFAEGKGVLLVDTEHGEARTYADDFEFDEFIWQPPYDPRELISFLRKHGSEYGCIVIDSLSHFYNGEGGLLNIVDAGAARAAGNSFAGWKLATPIQNEMIDTLKRVPCHLIVTMRSKMEYVLQTNSKGRQEPVKVGMAPIQREGFEYEMTFIAELDLEHRLVVTKSRYSGIADKIYRPQHQTELATDLMAWLSTAKPEAGEKSPMDAAMDAVEERVPEPSAAHASSPQVHASSPQVATSTQQPEAANGAIAPKPPAEKREPLFPEPQVVPANLGTAATTTNSHWVDTLRLLPKVPRADLGGILTEFGVTVGTNGMPTNADLRTLPDDKGLALMRTLEITLEGVR
jgi:energy-coupling factor transporter ATP-binding protein EcfA2